MEINSITSSQFKINTWSGGKTTQFYIYPPTATYQKLNFDFRLSMATVAIENSIFTTLPNISRTLMVLEGNITLNHENKYSKQLGKFDKDEFEGGWKTSCIGKCTDFNLMTSGDTKGTLAAINIKQNKNTQHPIHSKWDWIFMYIYSGKIEIDINTKTYSLNQGDLLVINKPENTNISINASENSILIVSEIAN
ncbi:HutD family protein [Aquimarina longa]|uniref:HutD/Ves family protein n=1 Tax=Aquimarina longa TaxID=1080221 RepID=UPI0007809B0E|nr:HutD family protein [Aquimarina longa]